MADYKSDPAEQFRTDVHRRVAGHLSAPDEPIGYTPTALFARLEPDFHTPVATLDDLKAVLYDLEGADLVDEPDEGVFRLTQEGFDLLTGPIANEPDPEAEGPSRPVRLDAATPLSTSARGSAAGA